ncbi:cobalt ABC transporter ATP-binding protein [Pseudoclavibacter sp. RFBJ3]|uniref:energy-coupling factor ABC transporter ATP-binding protein n=1 Tax=unclassified Pseudoclavibacter TaxID=2615177 RepID=UPI000CE8E5D6|nr:MULTISPECIES: ABC transporter ATP-binding protein [unclassified Pseudoclavibacter]PPF86584.1 cobalt ABC transporter ATP-binding protein [Pseudoclavibacter sp. RFBJ5]PPF95317.1 cobalt ABC transporter ATP-binding protein [Pseudoclavibacter sp. RFBJ3]PPF97751.1 cobalt ABC transporter ATP-binding protein [Pseudoclavibacter sp. RFBH5]PPG22596.1 cobalt ABC transporter ATP-binding protein [Pseudoclavibacter sp. RFBI4]
MIELRDVSVSFGDGAQRRSVLDGISVTLGEQRIGVIGANGSGKSSLARLFNGLLLPTSGTVSVEGFDTRRAGREVRRRVGFCFTDPDSQIIMPTVGEDVAFGLGRRGLSRAEISARTAAALEQVGLADRADHPAHLLSGGQKQLLALAAVLVTEPSILVLDEPTTLLDLRNSRAIAARIATLPQQVVLVTHDLEILAGFDRVLVVHEGRLTFDGPPRDAVAAYRAAVSLEGGL